VINCVFLNKKNFINIINILDYFNKNKKVQLNPWQYLVLSFSLLIFAGSLLLMTPVVEHTDGLSYIDALFTSTSAVCVTGLVTLPTSGFNIYGQLAILLLIQLGAIGIMTLTSSFLLALKGSVSLQHRINFSKLQENYELQDANQILKNILKITFTIEAIGMILLTIGFLMEGDNWHEALYQGFFHSISAFCNAGFSTYDSSIIGLNALIKYTISFLIVFGGIGYFVIYEVIEHCKNKRNLSLHSKIALLTSLFLIIVGSIFLYFFRDGHINLTDSFFQSVTARTAGFNSVDLKGLSFPSIFIMLILMFIGASPGSTGGGIKTTTFFIILYSIITILRGKNQVVIFKRTIRTSSILKAFATTIIYLSVISLGVIILFHNHSFKFEEVLFEVVSAIGTVGLSLGITPHLTTMGKVIIILLMFIGRLGPASFAMATIKQEKEVQIKYPEGDLY